MPDFNYHRAGQKKKTFWRSGIFIVVVVTLYFFGSFLFSPLSGPLSALFRPAWWASDGLGSAEQAVIDFFRNRDSLAIVNRQLMEDNARLESTILVQNQAEADNAYLRQVLGRVEKKETPIVGQIIFLPNFVPYETLLIDLGQNNLVRPLKIGS